MKAAREPKGQQTLLRIFFGERDARDGEELRTLIVDKACELGLAGCTVLRGISGFGASGNVHSDFPPDYADDLPIIIEVVDDATKVAALLNAVEPWLGGTLVTEEKLRVTHYRRKS